MASGKSTALANAVLDHVLGGPDYARVTPLYVALYNVTPSSVGGGTEVSGGAYARVSITNNVTNFPAASGGSKSNGVTITFPTATADWGTVTAAALHTHVTNDTPVYWGTLSASRSIPNGAICDFPQGTLTFTES